MAFGLFRKRLPEPAAPAVAAASPASPGTTDAPAATDTPESDSAREILELLELELELELELLELLELELLELELLLELLLELCEDNPRLPDVGKPPLASGDTASLQAIPNPANEAPDSNFRNSRRRTAPFAGCSTCDPSPDVLDCSARPTSFMRASPIFFLSMPYSLFL